MSSSTSIHCPNCGSTNVAPTAGNAVGSTMDCLACRTDFTPPPASAEQAHGDAPVCWRCKVRPGLVHDGTTHECIECAGNTMRRTREMLQQIDDVVREGLPIVPRIMDRVEFVRACIVEHRRRATEGTRAAAPGGGE